MGDVVAWLRQGNNWLVLLIPALMIAAALAVLTAPDPEAAPVAAGDVAGDAARLAQCKPVIDRLIASGDVVQRGDNRIELDDRQWDELMADEKRYLTAGWGCVVFAGRSPDSWAMMDYAVVYGRRSGKRLAMATSEGVVLE